MQNNEITLAEHFISIQGEGKYAGKLAYFLRFGACPFYRRECPLPKCDTMPRLLQQQDINVRFDEIETNLRKTNHIVLTGGEPTIYLNEVKTILERISNWIVESPDPEWTIEVETGAVKLKELFEALFFFNRRVIENTKNIFLKTTVNCSPKVLTEEGIECFQSSIADFILFHHIISDKWEQLNESFQDSTRFSFDTTLKLVVFPNNYYLEKIRALLKAIFFNDVIKPSRDIITHVFFMPYGENEKELKENAQITLSILKELVEMKRMRKMYGIHFPEIRISPRLHIDYGFE